MATQVFDASSLRTKRQHVDVADYEINYAPQQYEVAHSQRNQQNDDLNHCAGKAISTIRNKPDEKLDICLLNNAIKTIESKDEDENQKTHLKSRKKVPFEVGRIFNLYKSVEEKIHDFVLECSESYDIDLHSCIGCILGRYSKKRVKLPVLSEALLEQSSDYIFVEGEEDISGKIISFLNEILSRDYETLEVRNQDDETVVEDTMAKSNTSYEKLIAQYKLLGHKAKEMEETSLLSDPNTVVVDTYEQINLGCNVVYKPQSALHYQICATSKTYFYEEEEKINRILSHKIIQRSKKHVTTWVFVVKKHHKPGPKWIFKVIDEQYIDIPNENEQNVEKLKLLDESILSTKFHSHCNRNLDFNNGNIYHRSDFKNIYAYKEFYNSLHIKRIKDLLCNDYIDNVHSNDFNSDISKEDFVDALMSEQDEERSKRRRLYVRVCADSEQIKKQIANRKTRKPDGLRLIVRGLINNTRALVDYLGDELSCSFDLYYPSYFGDIAASVRQHYNKKVTLNAECSNIKALKKYNNMIKSCLIDGFVAPNCTVLDLACGHGQDLRKFIKKYPKHYVGIDISREEIAEARRRYTTMRLPYYAEFHVGNLLRKETYAFLNYLHNTFDIISIQLAIHYLTASEYQTREFLMTVIQYMPQNGLLIGSTVDCTALARRLKSCLVRIPSNIPTIDGNNDQGCEYTLGNGVYNITFNYDTIKCIRGGQEDKGILTNSPVEMYESVEIYAQRLSYTWGLTYNFWLTESIDQLEYVVPWEAFCKLATQCGLRLRLSMNFTEFLEYAKINNIGSVCQWLHRFSSQLDFDEEQQDVFSLYKVFIFSRYDSTTECYNIQHGNAKFPSGIDNGEIYFDSTLKERTQNFDHHKSQKVGKAINSSTTGKFRESIFNNNCIPLIDEIDTLFSNDNESRESTNKYGNELDTERNAGNKCETK